MKKAFMSMSCAAVALAVGFASTPVQAALYDFSFTGGSGGSVVSGSGQLTVTGGISPFTVTAATGTIYDSDLGPTGFVINGLSLYAGADNLFYFPQSVSQPYADFGGISFTTMGGEQFNLGGGGALAPYYLVLNDSSLNLGGYPGGAGSYDITLSVFSAPVPKPPTWATLLLLGYIVHTSVLRRRAQRP